MARLMSGRNIHFFRRFARHDGRAWDGSGTRREHCVRTLATGARGWAMDSIDQALMDAWIRVSQQLRDDPAEAARRFARLKLKTLRRPLRPWCLRLRASDTRIDSKYWMVAPELTPRGGPWPVHPPHSVWLDGRALRELMKPVSIDWPGVDWTEAARRLGRHQESIRGWIKRGVFKVKRYPARSVGKIGNPVAYVWSAGVIDPNVDGGPRKERSGTWGKEWGESWMGLHERVPREFGQMMTREPVFRKYPKKGKKARAWEEAKERFRGWMLVCPGRMMRVETKAGESKRDAQERVLAEHRAVNARAELVEQDGKMYVRLPCEKRVDSLYCPMPVWTIAKWIGDEWAMVVGEDEVAGVRLRRVHVPGVRDTVMPGMEQWKSDMTARAFACAKCWKVRHCAMTNRHGWNEMVSHLSGGLLYGRDVQRPREGRIARTRREFLHGAEHKVDGRVVARRERVEEMLLRGEKMRVIAETLGISVRMVWRDAKKIYGKEGVRTRKELMESARLGRVGR